MTFKAICGVACLDMVWVGGAVIIFPVTINAFNAKRFKLKKRCRFMTAGAIGPIMRAQQRKTASPMDLCDIFNNP
jgi:hypothetical protein